MKNKKEKPDERLFFDLDGHMTPAGNRIVAREFAEDSLLREMIEMNMD